MFKERHKMYFDAFNNSVFEQQVKYESMELFVKNFERTPKKKIQSKTSTIGFIARIHLFMNLFFDFEIYSSKAYATARLSLLLVGVTYKKICYSTKVDRTADHSTDGFK